VPKQSSRQVAKQDDLDLTPPEEIRARRIKRFVLLGAVIACVLGVAIYFGARPVGGAIKAWQSRRLAYQAFALIEQKKWSEANAKARDAYFLRPSEPQSWRAIARLASRTNQWPPALEWWKKVDDVHRLTVEDRRDYVSAALVTGDMWLVKSLLATTIPFWHSIMPNVRSPISAQGRMTFSQPQHSFSRSQAPLRNHMPVRGNKLKM